MQYVVNKHVTPGETHANIREGTFAARLNEELFTQICPYTYRRRSLGYLRFANDIKLPIDFAKANMLNILLRHLGKSRRSPHSEFVNYI